MNYLAWHKEDLRTEQQQLFDEGRDTSSVDADFARLLAEDVAEDEQFQRLVDELLDKTRLLPIRADYPYIEPSNLKTIISHRAEGPRLLSVTHSEAELKNRIKGAWLGRCAGCLLGKPIEFTRTPKLKLLLDRAACKEIPDYFWRLPGLTEKDYQEVDFEYLWKFYRNTDSFPGDDDTDYTVMGMVLLKNRGLSFISSDVAEHWLGNMPFLRTYTAERVAYRNFVNGVAPPDSAVFRNPYREWIGAQIRADIFGYAAAGQPELAAELAWRDASISHVKNGIYGAMWVAAMLAAAVTETEIRRVIEIGLTEIPAKSRLYEAITEILERHAASIPYFETQRYIHQRWDENRGHHWCHVLANAQIVAMGLLYSEGDYEKAITRAVVTGFDTDCNGATTGSIMGMMLGADALPEKWTGVMNDTIHTNVQGYQKASISAVAEEMFRLHSKRS